MLNGKSSVHWLLTEDVASLDCNACSFMLSVTFRAVFRASSGRCEWLFESF